MATTKIIPEVLDLNSATSDKGLKMPSGTEFNRPTDTTGQIRNNTNEASQGSSSAQEYYNGTEWKKITNIFPPSFNTVLYTGTNATHAITGVGFAPDLVWIKDRNNPEQHILNDSTRGAGYDLSPDRNNGEANRVTGFLSFNSDGFTLGTDGGGVVNDSARGPYVAWCWKVNGGTTSSNTDGSITSTVQANTVAGCSIVTYSGNGTAGATVGHGLSTTPDMIIVKQRNGLGNWLIQHKDMNASPQNGYLLLNSTDAFGTLSSIWNNTAPNSTTFTLGNFSGSNGSGNTFVSYCFNSVAGYSSFGGYTGNGSATGPIVTTGFEPSFVMGKRTDVADNWWMLDNKRNTSNPRNTGLFPNSTSAELTGGYSVDFLSNGFQLATADGALNANGGTYIYMAFK
jgi:hypothetical protein